MIWRELFEAVAPEGGDARPALDVLVGWVGKLRKEAEWLHAFSQRTGNPVPPAAPDDLYRLYAVDRINQLLLLRFQDGAADGSPYRGPDLTVEDYALLMGSLGFRAVRETTFHPFFHEIVSVEQSASEDEPIALREEIWPALMLGDMMFSRAGARVSGGRRSIRKDIAESSTLYWTHRRKNRPCADGSRGWGSNSQWRTSFRRDYRFGDIFYFNVDGSHSLAEAFGEDALDRDGRTELLVHRCLVTVDKPDDDLLRFDDTCAMLPDGELADFDCAAHLALRERLGERAYDSMYEADSTSAAASCYGDARDHFSTAIGIAGRLGRTEDVRRLTARLDRIRGVYRSQFSG